MQKFMSICKSEESIVTTKEKVGEKRIRLLARQRFRLEQEKLHALDEEVIRNSLLTLLPWRFRHSQW